MSHFVVIVIGDNHETQLAPYHEFECTGRDDEYVQDVDITERARHEFESDTKRRYIDPDGVHHDAYLDRFYRDPSPEEEKQIGPIAGTGSGSGIPWATKDWKDGKGYRTKVHFLPDGWSEAKIPAGEVQSFAQFIEGWYGLEPIRSEKNLDLAKTHKYGYVLLNKAGAVVKAVKRTNPNKKWEWYQVGGRWTGWLRLKPGAIGQHGEKSWASEHPKPGTADILRRCDIDFEGMMKEEADKAAAKYDKAKAITKEQWECWESVRKRLPIEQAREFYRNQPAVKALRDSGDDDFSWDIDDDLAGDRDNFIDKARNRAFVPYAFIKDGKWYAKGEMGWWGMSRNEADEAEWNKRVVSELLSLRDDTLITVVDCHT